MQIQPISFNVSNINLNYNHQNQAYQAKFKYTSNDSIHFTGFAETIEKTAKKCIRKENEIEEIFINLMNEVKIDKAFKKSEEFLAVFDIFERYGFRGTLHELWKANPRKNISDIVNKYNYNSINLATKENENKVELLIMGRQGFWNDITENINAPRDIRLCFSTPEYSITYYMDKKGDVAFNQSSSRKYFLEVYSTFHSSTGNLKKTVESFGDCSPETTYYNKDGSKPFFKNWFFGGPAVEPIY